jgi:hypothetical protein
MLSRRNLLVASAATSLAVMRPVAAIALSVEPMAPADLRALSLSCTASSGHADLLSRARAMLEEKIKGGAAKAGAEEVVTYPFCRCAFTVTADSGS